MQVRRSNGQASLIQLATAYKREENKQVNMGHDARGARSEIRFSPFPPPKAPEGVVAGLRPRDGEGTYERVRGEGVEGVLRLALDRNVVGSIPLVCSTGSSA